MAAILYSGQCVNVCEEWGGSDPCVLLILTQRWSSSGYGSGNISKNDTSTTWTSAYKSPRAKLPALARRDDAIRWKHFPRYWSFVRRIDRSTVNSAHKGQWHGALMFSLVCALNIQFSNQSWGSWFETPSRPLQRYCNAKSHLRTHWKWNT